MTHVGKHTNRFSSSARAHRRFCELLPQEHRSVEESLQARVSLEQILSLPELKVPAHPASLCYSF